MGVDSAVSVMTGYGLGGRGRVPAERSGRHDFYVQWILGILSAGRKWLACEVDHSPEFSAGVKNAELPPPTLET